jgi:GT2 family glycosyltransferase
LNAGFRLGNFALPIDRIMLPLGVVIPTKNSMPYLPRHVEGLRLWLDLAAEVVFVFVDSHSTDGTVDFLRANLRHPAQRFTTHPPGLSASWNHGITQISSRYACITTTRDAITRTGAGQLVETLHPTNASTSEKQSHLTAQRSDALLRAAMDS